MLLLQWKWLPVCLGVFSHSFLASLVYKKGDSCAVEVVGLDHCSRAHYTKAGPVFPKRVSHECTTCIKWALNCMPGTGLKPLFQYLIWFLQQSCEVWALFLLLNRWRHRHQGAKELADKDKDSCKPWSGYHDYIKKVTLFLNVNYPQTVFQSSLLVLQISFFLFSVGALEIMRLVCLQE